MKNRLLIAVPMALILGACTASVTTNNDDMDLDTDDMIFDSSSSFDPNAPYLEAYSSSADSIELNVNSSSSSAGLSE